MIDRQGRDAAAVLIARFRDGELTNDQFADAWPASADPALRAISTRLWTLYDDQHEHRLTGRYALSPEADALMTRCALFARTDSPYEWVEDDFIGAAGLGWRIFVLGLLLAGLLSVVWWPLAPLPIIGFLVLDQWIKRKNARFDARLAKAGELAIWPFIRRDDYDRSLEHDDI